MNEQELKTYDGWCSKYMQGLNLPPVFLRNKVRYRTMWAYDEPPIWMPGYVVILDPSPYNPRCFLLDRIVPNEISAPFNAMWHDVLPETVFNTDGPTEYPCLDSFDRQFRPSCGNAITKQQWLDTLAELNIPVEKIFDYPKKW